MSELDDFLTDFLPQQIAAEEAIHNGDPGPRLALWSTHDPVTVFGAVISKQGWEDVSGLFLWLGESFSDCTSYQFELIAAGAGGDLAYTVGYEHTAVSVNGVPVKPYTLRVTHVYRREDGQWKIAHRHGDYLPAGQLPSATEQVSSPNDASP